MDKLELIEKIIDFHPAYEAGTKRGWSWYVGGMKDTGEWYFRKLLTASIEELQQCLDELEAIKNQPDKVYTEEELIDLHTTVIISPGVWSNMYQIKLMRKIMEDQTNAMLWGRRK